MQLTFESTAHNHMLCEMKRKKKKNDEKFQKANDTIDIEN